MPPLYHRVWYWLRMNVQYETFLFPTKGRYGIYVAPGQKIASIQQIAEGVKWTEWGREVVPNKKTIRDILGWLQSREMIAVESNAKGTLITIVNWHTYNEHGTAKVTLDGQHMDRTVDTNKKDKKVKKEKSPKPSSSEALRLSERLAGLILQNNPSNTNLVGGKMPATVANWAADIDKLNRIDAQPWETIESVIEWCQADSFWSANILSGKKLREKFNQLTMKMSAKPVTHGYGRHSETYADPTRGAI